MPRAARRRTPLSARGSLRCPELPRLDDAAKNPHQNEPCVAGARCPARSCVLSRANSAAIGAPCVLVSHAASALRRRRTILKRVLTDAQLVARCRAGDQTAWRELVERFSRYVYAISVQGFRLPEHDADDIFQEVFTRAYTHLDRLRDDTALRPWIAQLTRNLCLDRLRDSSRTQPVSDE